MGARNGILGTPPPQQLGGMRRRVSQTRSYLYGVQNTYVEYRSKEQYRSEVIVEKNQGVQSKKREGVPSSESASEASCAHDNCCYFFISLPVNCSVGRLLLIYASIKYGSSQRTEEKTSPKKDNKFFRLRNSSVIGSG
jgi:hypothetical protein